MPPRAHAQEVRILAAIANAVLDPAARERLLEARSESEVIALIRGEAASLGADASEPSEPRGHLNESPEHESSITLGGSLMLAD